MQVIFNVAIQMMLIKLETFCSFNSANSLMRHISNKLFIKGKIKVVPVLF